MERRRLAVIGDQHTHVRLGRRAADGIAVAETCFV